MTGRDPDPRRGLFLILVVAQIIVVGPYAAIGEQSATVEQAFLFEPNAKAFNVVISAPNNPVNSMAQ
jgi:hypothetical protein